MLEKYRFIGCEVVGTNRKEWWVHIHVANKRIDRKNKLDKDLLHEALQVFKTFVAFSCNGHPSEFFAAYYCRFPLNRHTVRYAMTVRKSDPRSTIMPSFKAKYLCNCKSIRIKFEAY